MRACLEISLKNFSDNVKTLYQANKLKKSFFCPIIKANSYGHGVLTLARVIKDAGIHRIGVVSFEEAFQLKELAGTMEIYIFGPCHPDQMQLCNTHHFIPVIGQWDQLQSLAKLKSSTVFHLKFNTGMNRFGFHPSEKEKVADYIKKNLTLKLSGLASHLNEGEQAASNKKNMWAIQQIHLFKQLVQFFKQSFPDQTLHTHLLASAGWLSLWSHDQQDPSFGFRPGICLYGIKPPLQFFSKSAEQAYHSIHLKPVSCLKAFILEFHHLSAGQPVSYGNQYITKKKSIVAIVSMGYADGLPYHLSHKGEVLFRGQRVPIIGPICMDCFMIDVTEASQTGAIQKGEEVVIFGQQQGQIITVEEQAEKADSIPKEFFTQLGNRVQRVYK